MSLLLEENEGECCSVKNVISTLLLFPPLTDQILHLEQIIILVTRYKWQM